MSRYKRAVDRVRQHRGVLCPQMVDNPWILSIDANDLLDWVSLRGCLITERHDLNPKFSGRDFIVNLLIDQYVLHVAPNGEYSLHRWTRKRVCAHENRIPQRAEFELLNRLFSTAATI